MLPLKVAFQGGGARLVTLIAAAHALRDMADAGEVVVQRVAGTSAGSIAACMFASGDPFDEQLDRLREIGPSLVRSLRSRGTIPTPRLVKVAMAEPLLNEEALRNLIRTLFYRGARENRSVKLRDFQVETYISLSDVLTRSQYIATPDDDRELLDIVADSCALPIIFRTVSSKKPYVDGGICANLPADAILKNGADDAVPVAFRFKSDHRPLEPKTLEHYAMAIMAAAIDSSVELSAASVERAGGTVCELPDHFDTLDFLGALTTGLRPDHYASTKLAIDVTLRSKLRPLKVERERALLLSNARPRDQVIFDAHHSVLTSFPYRILETTTVVQASSLFQQGDDRRNPNDMILQTYTAQAKNPIIALRVAMPYGGVPVQANELCMVHDVNGEDLDADCVIVRADDPTGRDDKVDYILVTLSTPALPEQMPLTVTYRTTKPSCMDGILDGSGDYMRARTGGFGDGGVENHVLMLPSDFPAVEVNDLREHAHRLGASRHARALRHTDGRWSVGRPMANAELNKIFRGHPVLGAQPGMRSIGWTVEAAPADTYSGALFTLKKPR